MLGEYNWAFVPYAKPGAGLAAMVLDASPEPCDVYVLGNHGLLIGAPTVEEACALTSAVVKAVTEEPVAADTQALGPATIETPFGAFEALPDSDPLNAAASANQPTRANNSQSRRSFPIRFCSVAPISPSLNLSKTLMASLKPLNARYGKRPSVFLLSNKGAYVRADAALTEREMVQCIGDVMARVPENAELTFITADQCAALLNWDAETYRHRMNTA